MQTVLDLLPNFVKRIVVRFLTDHFFDNYGLFIWRKIISKVSTNSNIMPTEFGTKFAGSRVASRIYFLMFYFPRPISLRDISVCLALEAIDNNFKLEPKFVIQFARAIFDYWVEELSENDLLNERLRKKTGKKIAEIIIQHDEETQDLIEILQDKTRTREEFFKLYSTNKETDSKVIVYLPNELEYIDWYDGPKIEISINSFKSIDLGFFRLGYDYKFVDLDRSSWAVSISKDGRSEVVEFVDNKFIGKPTKNYIWLR